MNDPDSGDLLLVAAGDVSALDRVVARWKSPVYAIFSRTRDAASAAEATADVFDRLRSRAKEYEPAGRADVFLHRLIAERILRDGATTLDAISPATLSASAAARNAFVRSAVASLPATERAAFLLTRVAGLSNEVAAEALRMPVAEVQHQIVQAMATLRAALEPAVRIVPALGPVERHFGPEPSGTPADLDHRLAVRLHAPSAPSYRWGRAIATGSAIGVAVVMAAIFALRRGEPKSAPLAAAPAASAASETAAPDIVRVPNAPVTVDTIPANEAEEKQAIALFPPAFLLMSETLAGLDPFFPEDLGVERAGPPSPRPTLPPRSPASTPEELAERIALLRHLKPTDRARLLELDEGYRARPEAQRVSLWSRWEVVHGLGEDTLGGLRPLARRVAALPQERRSALAAELRSMRTLAPQERLRRFRADPFARGLTGQETAAAEALLR